MTKIVLRRLLLIIFSLVFGMTMVQFSSNLKNHSESDGRKAWFLSFLENRLSGHGQKINISDIDGIFASQVSVNLITVADRKGVWLKINNVKLDWNRTALLAGRVSINSLSAEQIEVLRRPVLELAMPRIVIRDLSLPILSTTLTIGSLKFREILFDEQLLGQALVASLDGYLTYSKGAFSFGLDIKWLDDSDSLFQKTVNYVNDKKYPTRDHGFLELKNSFLPSLLKIENQSSVNLSFLGKGGMSDNLDAKAGMGIGDCSALKILFKLNIKKDGRIFNLTMNGPVSMLMPEIYRPLFGWDARFDADGIMTAAGGLRLNKFLLEGSGIRLSGQAEMKPDGFLRQLVVDGLIAFEEGKSPLVPIPNEKTEEKMAMALNLTYGMPGTDLWTGTLAIHNLKTENFHADNIIFSAGGPAENLDDPTRRHVGMIIKGTINGITSSRLDIIEIIGTHVSINADMDWQMGSPLIVKGVKVNTEHLALSGKGAVKNFLFQGNFGMQIDDLMKLSGLVDHSLSGRIDLTASAKIDLADSAFDINLDGIVSGLPDTDIVGHIFGDKAIFSGSISSNQDRLGRRIRSLRIGSKGIEIAVDGCFAAEMADVNFRISLSNLEVLDSRMRGPFVVEGIAHGHNGVITIGLDGSITEGTWWEHKLANLVISFNGTLDKTSPVSQISGMVTGSGLFGGEKLMLSSAFHTDGDKTIMDDLSMVVGKAELHGNFVRDLYGFIDGKLCFDAADISKLAALFFMEGKGIAHADIMLSAESNKQNAMINADINDLDVIGIRIASLSTKIALHDLFSIPQADGTLNGSAIHIAGYDIESAYVSSTIQDQGLYLVAKAEFKKKIVMTISGILSSFEARDWQFLLKKVELHSQQDIKLTSLCSSKFFFKKNGHVSISDFVMNIGNGFLTIDGIIADTVNLVIEIKNVPISVSNLILPETDSNGIIKGVINITGSRTNPSVDFYISVSGLSAKSLRKNGIELLNLNAHGKIVGEILGLNTRSFSRGLDVAAQSRIFTAQQKVDFDITLKDASHSALNPAVKDQIFSGSISIFLRISSIFTNPMISFSIEGNNFASKWLTDAGLSPVYLSSTGFYSDNILKFKKFYLTDAKVLDIKMSGRFPFSGYGSSDFKVDGSMPLTLANYFLVDRGSQLSGVLTINATARGNLERPYLDGTFSMANGQFTDPELNIWLNAITISGRFREDQVFLEHASAISASGGSLSLVGQISVSVVQGFPTNLTLNFNHTRYTNGKILITISHGKVTISGPLIRNPLIAGDIFVEKAEIDIPENSSNVALIDIQHRHLTASVAKTLERARIKIRAINTPATACCFFAPELDLQIKAANRVFVHGRGLNVELRGQLHLVGPVTDIHPIGGFNMVHGRFDILARHLNFREGQITMAGNMNPELYFVAAEDVDGINLIVEVSGMPQNLKLNFTSQPTLPQDEILSRLIFKRPIRELSPFQVVQLVDATAELVGIRDKSIFSSLRSGIGLDKLNFVTDALGNTGVEAGRYIQNNLYLGVETVAGGTSRGTVNLNISHSLKAKAAVGSNSNSNAGVFYEKDY